MILWRIELPLVRMAVIGAFIFSFAAIFDEATLAIFLSPVTDVTLAQQLYRSAAESIAPTLSAVSTMITLLAIARPRHRNPVHPSPRRRPQRR